MARGLVAYVVLDVDYKSDDCQTLGWIAPELANSGLKLTEDGESEFAEYGAVCHRKWVGIIPKAVYRELRDSWSLQRENAMETGGILTAEYGLIPAIAWSFDGMEWNTGGSTPIFQASLYVSFAMMEKYDGRP